MQEFSVEELLNGIKERDKKVLDFIYKSSYSQIQAFIIRNHGSLEDAQDIYQDAILVIYQKLQYENLMLSCSFNTYLFSVSRLLWLKQLERKKQWVDFREDPDNYVVIDESLLFYHETNERYRLYLNHFQRLSYSCQKILELFLAKIPLKEVARIMGYKSEHYVKKRKHLCKEKLVASIKNDPEFVELSQEFTIKKISNG